MLVGAVALLAGACGGSGSGTTDATAPAPPDRLTVSLVSGYGGAFRVSLDCAVADRAACAEVLRALADERDAERCEPIDDAGPEIAVSGTIQGQEVRAQIARRTDCEARLYDRVSAAVSP